MFLLFIHFPHSPFIILVYILFFLINSKAQKSKMEARVPFCSPVLPTTLPEIIDSNNSLSICRALLSLPQAVKLPNPPPTACKTPPTYEAGPFVHYRSERHILAFQTSFASRSKEQAVNQMHYGRL